MVGGNSTTNTNTNTTNDNSQASTPIAPNNSRQTGPAPPRSPGRPPIPTPTQARVQDCYMPVANVVRIMRRAIPPNGKISDETKETVQECVTEFISFITEEANQKVCEDHRKTINGDDLVWAMRRLGFDNYADTLETYLTRYREVEGSGLSRSDLASRQRRQTNRSAGIQIGSCSTPQPVSRPTTNARIAPAIMPPIPMINPQEEMVSPLGNHSYFNDGPVSSPGVSVDFNSNEGGYLSSLNPNPGPSSSMTCDLPNISSPTSSDEAEMNFLNQITNFK